MSASEDIRNLFGKFDGQAQQYQEVSREDQAVQARTRWPLLSSIALDESEEVPAVGEAPALAVGADAVGDPGRLPGGVIGSASRPAASTVGSVPSNSTGARASDVREGATRRSSLQSVLFGGVKKRETAAATTPPSSLALRQGAPAFRVQSGPVRPEPASPEPDRAMKEREPPSVVRGAAHAHAVSARSAYPPVVSPQTSTLHAAHAQDFAPPVVPVNHFAPEDESKSPFVPLTPLASLMPHAVDPMAAANVSGSPPSVSPASGAERPAHRPSILGRLFAPPVAPTYEVIAPTATPGAAPRDLRSVFSRLAGGEERMPTP